MKIYRIGKDKEKSNDMIHGLPGYLAETKAVNLYGMLIKNRNTSLLLPGGLFAKSCNAKPGSVKFPLFGYKNWSSLMELYSTEEIKWAYELGYSIYEIDIQPKHLITSKFDKLQCAFDYNKCTSIKKLSLEEVIDSYEELAEIYISINLVDELVDDSLVMIKFLLGADVSFTLSFRDKYCCNSTDPKDYKPKKELKVVKDSDVWNKLKSITEIDCSNTKENIDSFIELYNEIV